MDEKKSEKFLPKITNRKVEDFLTLETGDKGDRQLYKLKKTFDQENIEYGVLEKQIKVTFKEKTEKRFIDHIFMHLSPNERQLDRRPREGNDDLVFLEEEFRMLYLDLIKSFSDPSLFTSNQMENINKYILTELDKCKTKKQLCQTLLNVFHCDDKLSEHSSIQTVINLVFKNNKSEQIHKFRHIINALTFNFTKLYYAQFNELQTIKKVYKELNIERGVLAKGNILYSSHFHYANVFGENLEDNDLINTDFETIIIMQLAKMNSYDQTTNYLRVPDRDKVLICPFTKFKVTEIKYESEKILVYMEEIKENYFVDLASWFLFNSNLKNNNNLYQKLLLYYQNEVNLISSLFGENNISKKQRKKPLRRAAFAWAEKA